MRVVLNAYTTIGNKTGIGRYTEELLRCLQDGFARIIVRVSAFLGPRLRAPGGNRIRPPNSRRPRQRHQQVGVSAIPGIPHLPVATAGAWVLWMYDRSVLRKSKFDLYHEPNYIPIPCNIPTVVTIHDLSIVRHPEWHPKERVAFFERNFPRGLRAGPALFHGHRTRSPRDDRTAEHPAGENYLYLLRHTDRSCADDRGAYRPVLHRLGLPERVSAARRHHRAASCCA